MRTLDIAKRLIDDGFYPPTVYWPQKELMWPLVKRSRTAGWLVARQQRMSAWLWA